MSRSAPAAEAATHGRSTGPSGAELATLFAPFAAHGRVLLAVSGGPDSTALMLLAQRWQALCGGRTELHVATVDHGLRAESRAEAQAIRVLAQGLGLPHAILDLPAKLPGTRLQEAARHARYEALAAHADAIGAGALATAHTRDDQAETVLFRLMRGSGLGGLAGIPAARPLGSLALLRPLLGLPKAELVALCRTAGIGFVVDPSNSDPRFARARLRELLPSLAAEGLDAAALTRLARRMARAEAALEASADAAAATLWTTEGGTGGPIRLARAGLAALPEEIVLRLVGRAIAARGEGPVELAKLEALAGWIAGLGAAEHGARTLAGALVRVNRHAVTIGPAPRRRPVRDVR
ncbi:tRNA lysidine(34) synthetase TilS [Ancylobacter dichloromethanicus]|uniref:tRNA(Ile)-lysidine synthase n=1 Tax=Ancylobacter dichloromethanicus TaxID=518825 RepID=A0A9W6J775_9HYPH|nr:tRNA lysidine(34) synthetase TilS [Ancylobacter dichloromethanicus]MBS7555323.1 tRNA lysidine(34) synthetase TilS [Ancylobacter dichloromethanicus]GLK70505.1 tRNA(Ile)-lysidine synthase [Ancylobacter dichloromethanicus]